MGFGFGDREANTGRDNASWHSKVCTPGGAAVQDTTAGNQVSKVVGEVLNRYDVFSDGFVTWIHLCLGLHRRVRVRRVLSIEVEGGRLPGTTGVPGWLISDGALEQRTRHWQEVVRDYQIRQTLTEPYSPWQNRAEGSIKAVKRGIRRFMQSEGSPKRTWCFCGEWYAGTRRLTAHDTPALHGRVPAERVGGDTPDISMYVQFSWYQ